MDQDSLFDYYSPDSAPIPTRFTAGYARKILSIGA